VPFNEKDVSEQVVLTFSFANELLGESIAGTPNVLVTVISGTDSSPSSILSGAATVQQGLVLQGVRAGVAGTTYEVKAIAATSGNRILARYGYLPVVNA
jgi:hypothetical protein